MYRRKREENLELFVQADVLLIPKILQTFVCRQFRWRKKRSRMLVVFDKTKVINLAAINQLFIPWFNQFTINTNSSIKTVRRSSQDISYHINASF